MKVKICEWKTSRCRDAICFLENGFMIPSRFLYIEKKNVLSWLMIIHVRNMVERIQSISTGGGSLIIVIFPGTFCAKINTHARTLTTRCCKSLQNKTHIYWTLFQYLRFNGTTLLENLRGKRVIFVGDSVNKNQWISLLCLLETSVPLSERLKQWHGSLMTFRSSVSDYFILFYCIFFFDWYRSDLIDC